MAQIHTRILKAISASNIEKTRKNSRKDKLVSLPKGDEWSRNVRIFKKICTSFRNVPIAGHKREIRIL